MTQSKGDTISPKLSVTATIIKDAGDFGYPRLNRMGKRKQH